MDEALRAFGLVADKELGENECECYPDNWLPLQVFQAMARQWTVASHGAVIGMRYEALPAVLDLMPVPRKRRSDVFWALREMEVEALAVFNKRRD